MRHWRIDGLEMFQQMIEPDVRAISQLFAYDYRAQG